MIAHDSTGLQSVGTADPNRDEKQPFEGTCGCDGDLFPCFQCHRNGRRGLPSIKPRSQEAL